jgi:hypothetical protein
MLAQAAGIQISPFFFIILFAVVAAAGAIIARRLARQRREAMAQLARELGWRFRPDNDDSISQDYPKLGLFDHGRQRYAYNTLNGTIDVSGRSYGVQMGDYRYTEGSGKNQHTYRVSYLVATVPFPFVPDLNVHREGLFDRLTQAIGFADIDFESAEFSRKYTVKSPDRRFAYALIHPRMIEFFLQVQAPAIRIHDRHVLLREGLSRWDPDAFRRQLAWARQFFALWPDNVTEQLEYKPEEGTGAA